MKRKTRLFPAVTFALILSLLWLGRANDTYAQAFQVTPSNWVTRFVNVRDANPHPRQGYILTRNVDPFGGPVAFVFTGATSRQVGADVFLDTVLLNQSLNARLMRGGYVYPAFYADLPSYLRDHLTDLAISAWNNKPRIMAS